MGTPIIQEHLFWRGKSACGSYGGQKKLGFLKSMFLGGKNAPAAATEGPKKLFLDTRDGFLDTRDGFLDTGDGFPDTKTGCFAPQVPEFRKKTRFLRLGKGRTSCPLAKALTSWIQEKGVR